MEWNDANWIGVGCGSMKISIDYALRNRKQLEGLERIEFLL
jgi:hypothetical protein